MICWCVFKKIGITSLVYTQEGRKPISVWYPHALDWGYYDPIRSGMIDGSNCCVHDRAVIRALNSKHSLNAAACPEKTFGFWSERDGPAKVSISTNMSVCWCLGTVNWVIFLNSCLPLLFSSWYLLAGCGFYLKFKMIQFCSFNSEVRN